MTTTILVTHSDGKVYVDTSMIDDGPVIIRSDKHQVLEPDDELFGRKASEVPAGRYDKSGALVKVTKYNENHDERGRFASGPGGGKNPQDKERPQTGLRLRSARSISKAIIDREAARWQKMNNKGLTGKQQDALWLMQDIFAQMGSEGILGNNKYIFNFVLDSKDRIMGGIFAEVSGKAVHIEDLASFRPGSGQNLLHSAVAAGQAMGATHVDLQATPGAVGFYYHMGFKSSDDEHFHARIKDLKFMRRQAA